MYSKQNYNYGRHGRKRKLKPIPVIITLLIVILILGGIYFLLFNGKNKYEDYNTYNETNKQYGTVQHYEKENDDGTDGIHGFKHRTRSGRNGKGR